LNAGLRHKDTPLPTGRSGCQLSVEISSSFGELIVTEASVFMILKPQGQEKHQPGTGKQYD
jgi:hypothetical protein